MPSDFTNFKASQSTSFGVLEATAHAGQDWGKWRKEHPEITDTAELEKKAREIVTAAPMRDDNTFLKTDGTQQLAQNYSVNLMNRSEKLDEEQGKAKGANLIAYMDDAAAAVKDLDIEKAKIGGVPMSELNKIREKFSKSSVEHLGVKGTYLEDFNRTVQESEGKEDSITKDVKIEPKAAPMGFLELLVKLIGMFLGIDLGSLFAGPDQTESQKRDAASITLVSKETEKTFNEMIPLAEQLREGKDMKKNLDELHKLNGKLTKEGAGKPRRELTEEEAKKFGQQVLDDITKVRTGQMKQEEMGGELSKSLASADQKPAHGLDIPLDAAVAFAKAVGGFTVALVSGDPTAMAQSVGGKAPSGKKGGKG